MSDVELFGNDDDFSDTYVSEGEDDAAAKAKLAAKTKAKPAATKPAAIATATTKPTTTTTVSASSSKPQQQPKVQAAASPAASPAAAAPTATTTKVVKSAVVVPASSEAFPATISVRRVDPAVTVKMQVDKKKEEKQPAPASAPAASVKLARKAADLSDISEDDDTANGDSRHKTVESSSGSHQPAKRPKADGSAAAAASSPAAAPAAPAASPKKAAVVAAAPAALDRASVAAQKAVVSNLKAQGVVASSSATVSTPSINHRKLKPMQVEESDKGEEEDDEDDEDADEEDDEDDEEEEEEEDEEEENGGDDEMDEDEPEDAGNSKNGKGKGSNGPTVQGGSPAKSWNDFSESDASDIDTEGEAELAKGKAPSAYVSTSSSKGKGKGKRSSGAGKGKGKGSGKKGKSLRSAPATVVKGLGALGCKDMEVSSVQARTFMAVHYMLQRDAEVAKAEALGTEVEIEAAKDAADERMRKLLKQTTTENTTEWKNADKLFAALRYVDRVAAIKVAAMALQPKDAPAATGATGARAGAGGMTVKQKNILVREEINRFMDLLNDVCTRILHNRSIDRVNLIVHLLKKIGIHFTGHAQAYIKQHMNEVAKTTCFSLQDPSVGDDSEVNKLLMKNREKRLLHPTKRMSHVEIGLFDEVNEIYTKFCEFAVQSSINVWSLVLNRRKAPNSDGDMATFSMDCLGSFFMQQVYEHKGKLPFSVSDKFIEYISTGSVNVPFFSNLVMAVVVHTTEEVDDARIKGKKHTFFVDSLPKDITKMLDILTDDQHNAEFFAALDGVRKKICKNVIQGAIVQLYDDYIEARGKISAGKTKALADEMKDIRQTFIDGINVLYSIVSRHVITEDGITEIFAEDKELCELFIAFLNLTGDGHLPTSFIGGDKTVSDQLGLYTATPGFMKEVDMATKFRIAEACAKNKGAGRRIITDVLGVLVGALVEENVLSKEFDLNNPFQMCTVKPRSPNKIWPLVRSGYFGKQNVKKCEGEPVRVPLWMLWVACCVEFDLVDIFEVVRELVSCDTGVDLISSTVESCFLILPISLQKHLNDVAGYVFSKIVGKDNLPGPIKVLLEYLNKTRRNCTTDGAEKRDSEVWDTISDLTQVPQWPCFDQMFDIPETRDYADDQANAEEAETVGELIEKLEDLYCVGVALSRPKHFAKNPMPPLLAQLLLLGCFPETEQFKDVKSSPKGRKRIPITEMSCRVLVHLQQIMAEKREENGQLEDDGNKGWYSDGTYGVVEAFIAAFEERCRDKPFDEKLTGVNWPMLTERWPTAAVCAELVAEGRHILSLPQDEREKRCTAMFEDLD